MDPRRTQRDRTLASLEVSGLFGYVTHRIEFRQDAPTIITAPNGAGKTHVLTLTHAALTIDAPVLLETPFTTLSLHFSDGYSLRVSREVLSGDPSVSVWVEYDGRILGRTVKFSSETLDISNFKAPPFLKRISENRWLDTRTGFYRDREMLRRRYKLQPGVPAELLDGAPEVRRLCGDPLPVFIDTKRLDAAASELGGQDLGPARAGMGAATRIHEYTEQLRYEVNEARRNSVHATQSADLSFAARALAAAKKSVRVADLKTRYNRTVERYETLARNSLAVGEAPLTFPDETTPTVRRILSVFLDDWDKRLEPLLPLNEKIQTLRGILDSKLAPSGKKTAMSSRGGLEFRTFSDRRIRVANLSSGEQHLVALFTMLLFAAKPGSLLLIDEPEISLHAAWKHDFLEDIARVAEIGSLQIVMATHSSAIVNGRWDLAEELELAPFPDAQTIPDQYIEDDVDDIDE